MLKAQVTYLKKMPGGEQFSSEQFFCGLEAELADEVSAQTEALQARIRALYAEATKSVDEQVALFHGKNGNGNGGRQQEAGSRQQSEAPAQPDALPPTAGPQPTANGTQSPTPDPRPKNGGNGGNGSASNKQIKYALDLARQRRKWSLRDLNGFSQETVGVADIYKLTGKQMSAVLDALLK